MRLITSLFAVLTVFVSLSFSQTDDAETRLMLKQSFKQVSVVANIEIEKVEVDGEWKTQNNTVGYTIYRFTGKIVESFKGKRKKGTTITFYSFREGQPPTENLKKNFIRFLEIKKTDDGENRLLELENSGAAINKANLSMLRKLR